MPIRLRRWFLLALLPLLFFSASSSVHAAPAVLNLIVNDLHDYNCFGACPICNGSDDCTLRQAIVKANFVGDPATYIRFALSTDPNTSSYIFLSSSLPAISNTGTSIDGSTSVGGMHVNVVIDGQGISSSGSPLFTITGDHVWLTNLSIVDGANLGNDNPENQLIWVAGGQDARIANNTLGYARLNQSCPTASHATEAVYIDSSDGAAGLGQGAAYIYGNTISCMRDVGVMAMTPYVYIGVAPAGTPLGNYIGTLPLDSGTRNKAGVYVAQSSSVSYNTIVRNTTIGIGLLGASVTGNKLQGNSIRQQGGVGISIVNGANANLVGWDGVHGTSALGNVISANGTEGVYIAGSATANNVVAGNLIGTDATGLLADGNGVRGVLIDDNAHDNWIGAGSGFAAESTLAWAALSPAAPAGPGAAGPQFPSSLPAGGNVISGNGTDGIQVINGARRNIIAGNLIGTNVNNSAAIANGYSGIAIFGGAQNNVVGGASAGRSNLIAGNGLAGIYIAGSTTVSNTVVFNTIGANLLGNHAEGVVLSFGTHDNVIGGIGLANSINYNAQSGILLSATAHNNFIRSNVASANGLYGVLLEGNGTTANSVFGTVLSFNHRDGLAERDFAGGNTWSQLSVYSNAGLGIDKQADFGDSANVVDAPLISITAVNPTTGVVSGHGRSTGIGSTQIELYRVSVANSPFAQGIIYLGAAFTDGSGNWSITDPAPAVTNGCYVAFETNTLLFSASSEFTPSSCRQFLPEIDR